MQLDITIIRQIHELSQNSEVLAYSNPVLLRVPYLNYCIVSSCREVKRSMSSDYLPPTLRQCWVRRELSQRCDEVANTEVRDRKISTSYDFCTTRYVAHRWRPLFAPL